MTNIDMATLANVTGGFWKGVAKVGALVGGELVAAGVLNKIQGGKNCLGVLPMDSQAGYALCKPPTAPAAK